MTVFVVVSPVSCCNLVVVRYDEYSLGLMRPLCCGMRSHPYLSVCLYLCRNAWGLAESCPCALVYLRNNPKLALHMP